MSTKYPVKNFQKIQCPFVRERKGRKQYFATPELQEGYEWLYDDGVRAVDKLHGTNVCLSLDELGELYAMDNRTNRVLRLGEPVRGYDRKQWMFLEGICHAQGRGWLDDLLPGYNYGELVGPKINGNLHELDNHLFVPFSVLYERCHWHSWVKNKYPKNFESISDWLRELPSLFSEKYSKKNTLAEGLVFYHPDGMVCKIRRSMFPWYYERC